MTTFFNIIKSLLSASPKSISNNIQQQIIKGNCDDSHASGAYCYSEKPFISNF